MKGARLDMERATKIAGRCDNHASAACVGPRKAGNRTEQLASLDVVEALTIPAGPSKSSSFLANSLSPRFSRVDGVRFLACQARPLLRPQLLPLDCLWPLLGVKFNASKQKPGSLTSTVDIVHVEQAGSRLKVRPTSAAVTPATTHEEPATSS